MLRVPSLLFWIWFALSTPSFANSDCEHAQIAVDSLGSSSPGTARTPDHKRPNKGDPANPHDYDSAEDYLSHFPPSPFRLNPMVKRRTVEGQFGPIVKDIGKGGQSEIVLIEDKVTGKERLFKIANHNHPLIFDDFYSAKLFSAHELEHPGKPNPFLVTKFYPDFRALEMEMGEGDVLRSLSEYGPQHLDKSLDAVLQITHAITFANEHGVIHRDIKPDNILIMKGGRLVLADWGFAAEKGIYSSVQQPETSLGTPGFMDITALEGLRPTEEMDAHAARITAIDVVLGKLVEDPTLVERKVVTVHENVSTTGQKSEYGLYARSPHTIDPLVPIPISMALWHSAPSAKELGLQIKTAREYHAKGKDVEYVREVFSPLFQKAILENPQKAAREFLSSEEHIAAARDGSLELSLKARKKLWNACSDVYYPKKGEPIPPDEPQTVIDDPALKKSIRNWVTVERLPAVGRWITDRVGVTPALPF